MTEHCCIKLRSTLERYKTPLKYDARTRSYLMEYHLYRKPRKNDLILCETLSYCPFCRTKLPKQLNDELYRILQEEYHIDDTVSQVRAGNIPEEFKSDEWWKKRGL